MQLFNRKDAHVYLEEKKKELQKEILQIPDKDILTLNIEDFVNYFYDKFYIQPLKILKDEISSTLEKTKIERYNPFYRDFQGYEPKTFLVDGYRINYTIPFEGDFNLLFVRPSMRILCDFTLETINNMGSRDYLPTIQFSIEIEADKLEKAENPQELIDKTFNEEFKNYEIMMGYVNNNISSFNNSLKSTITELLNSKKNKSDKFTTLMTKINIPLKLNDNNINTTPITLSLPKEPAKYPQKSNESIKQWSIQEKDYENIKNIINQSCISFEKTAITFNKLEEEELRDVILSNLNTHYNSLATGETFSKKGKTDIRIQFENKAAYIAECKVWHGISEFEKAIEQLFSYTTWRDVKTSLIIFNKKNKDFVSILNKINDYLKENSLCLSIKPLSKNNWQCTFKKDNETDEKIELNILVCDIYV